MRCAIESSNHAPPTLQETRPYRRRQREEDERTARRKGECGGEATDGPRRAMTQRTERETRIDLTGFLRGVLGT